jgi:hypothetical protein
LLKIIELTMNSFTLVLGDIIPDIALAISSGCIHKY